MSDVAVGDTLQYCHPVAGPFIAEVIEVQPERIICRIAMGWPQIRHFWRTTGVSVRGDEDGCIIRISVSSATPLSTGEFYVTTS